MMIYRQHISQASAAASVHGPDILVAITRAGYQRPGAATIEYLEEARRDAVALLNDIDNAIRMEQQQVRVPTSFSADPLVALVAFP